MTESIKEKYTESLPEPITLKATEKILDQMNNGILEYLIIIKMVLDFL